MSETATDRGVAGVLLDLDGTRSTPSTSMSSRGTRPSATGHDVAQARIHAAVGMGSDRLVPWVLGRHVDDAGGIAEDHKQRFLEVAGGLRPTAGHPETPLRRMRRDPRLRPCAAVHSATTR